MTHCYECLELTQGTDWLTGFLLSHWELCPADSMLTLYTVCLLHLSIRQLHEDTLLLRAPNWAEQLLFWPPFRWHSPHHASHMPVSSFPNPLFFLPPIILLFGWELLTVYLQAFLFLPLQSVSLFPSAFSLFCVNSWDAFVKGFHSDGQFEQVVIRVHWL